MLPQTAKQYSSLRESSATYNMRTTALIFLIISVYAVLVMLRIDKCMQVYMLAKYSYQSDQVKLNKQLQSIMDVCMQFPILSCTCLCIKMVSAVILHSAGSSEQH